ncbi:MAG: hypothetical protein JNN27_17605 [Planctomycetes bacterium]|nr:hypothetical protein [Planctomycetota bacterium]
MTSFLRRILARGASPVVCVSLLLSAASVVGCRANEPLLVGTFQAEDGETLTLRYESPNHYFELTTATFTAWGGCRRTDTGLEVFGPSSSVLLGSQLVPNSTLDQVTVEWHVIQFNERNQFGHATSETRTPTYTRTAQ